MPKGKKGENKGFQDDKYKDWASERIYDDIYKTAKEERQEVLEKNGRANGRSPRVGQGRW